MAALAQALTAKLSALQVEHQRDIPWKTRALQAIAAQHDLVKEAFLQEENANAFSMIEELMRQGEIPAPRCCSSASFLVTMHDFQSRIQLPTVSSEFDMTRCSISDTCSFSLAAAEATALSAKGGEPVNCLAFLPSACTIDRSCL